MVIMSTDETADMENGLVAPENVFKEFWPILVPTQHQFSIFQSAVTVFRCQLLQLMGFPRTKIQAFLDRTYCVPRQSHFASSLTCYFTRAAGEYIPHQRHVLLRSGCGWTATSPCVRNRTCGQKLRMTILYCLLTDCGISSLHRRPPSLHSNH